MTKHSQKYGTEFIVCQKDDLGDLNCRWFSLIK